MSLIMRAFDYIIRTTLPIYSCSCIVFAMMSEIGRRFMRLPGTCLLVLTIAACATVPDADEIIDQSAVSVSGPQIMGSHGPLTEKQSQALLKRLSSDGKVVDALQRHLVIEQAVAESPLVAGNSTHILQDGPKTFKAIFDAIHGAKDHINLEYYIFQDVQYAGVHLSDALAEKLRQGVKVNVMYDSIGSIDTPAAFFDRLKQAGAKVVQFNPVNPLKANSRYSINDRDHRKIFIVDGKTAIVGGINLSADYQSTPFEGKSSASGQPANYWHDTDIQIDGPVVAQLQKLFVEQWNSQKGPALDTAKFYPNIAAKGTELARVIGSSPHSAASRYYVTLVSAIRNAEKSVVLTAAYFVPTKDEKDALIQAAKRGVDVRILLPSRSDSKTILAVQHSFYDDLLEAGVKIYELHQVILHSKTAVVDGVWSVVGSSNFDHRSVLFNDEVDVVVLGAATANELQAMFEEDLKKAQQVDLAAWNHRPIWQRANEAATRLLRKLF